jgi:hypothetical protein
MTPLDRPVVNAAAAARGASVLQLDASCQPRDTGFAPMRAGECPVLTALSVPPVGSVRPALLIEGRHGPIGSFVTG